MTVALIVLGVLAVLALGVFALFTMVLAASDHPLGPPEVIPQVLEPAASETLDQVLRQLEWAQAGWRRVGFLELENQRVAVATNGEVLASTLALITPKGEAQSSGLLLQSVTAEGRWISTCGMPEYINPVSHRAVPDHVDSFEVVGWAVPELLHLHAAQLEDARRDGRTVDVFTDPVRWILDTWEPGPAFSHPYGWVDEDGRGHLRVWAAAGAVLRFLPPVAMYRGHRANRRAARYLQQRVKRMSTGPHVSRET